MSNATSGDSPWPAPLSASEEATWRSFIRLMVVMPRAIDDDLQRRGGISLTRYVVLMRLSEVECGSLRMSTLAEAASISPSRLTRVVQAMTADGLLVRGSDPVDARATVISMTTEGRRVLVETWPAHLAGVRSLVIDHVPPKDLPNLDRIVRELLRVLEVATVEQRQRLRG